jgi:8-oxo-dGTP diphosphatase
MSEQQTPPMATPRVAAGALLTDEGGRVLLVKPTYKGGWDLPGGYVEPGETPLQACRREVREELGLEVEPNGLLVVDWAPHPQEGDKILFIFDGGTLNSAARAGIELEPSELAAHDFFPNEDLPELLIPRLHRRVSLALASRQGHGPIYAEDGRSGL